MNRKNQRILEFYTRAARHGIVAADIEKLRRIEMTLHRWAEHECNGNIQREGANADGKPRWYYEIAGKRNSYAIADKERGALKRLAKIMEKYPQFIAYHQGDPRGCALYLVPKKDIPKDVTIDCCYSRGFAVCY